MSKPQIIVSQSGERMVVLSEADYLTLLEQAEDAHDLAAVRTFDRKHEAGEEEFVPAAVVDRILSGESRLRVWRDHRGYSVAGLAEKAGLSPAYVSQIEAGSRTGSIATLQKLAAALQIDVDDLV